MEKKKKKLLKCGIEFMKELQKQGIISVIKHFPGHGAVSQDSHFFLPKIKIKIEQLEKEDMYPFEQAIKNGADSILMGHLVVKGVTRKIPASLSRKFITKYLRKKYHYNGLIITDDLKMRAIKLFFGVEKALKMAFEAGNDMILFRIDRGKQKQTVEQIYDLVRKGKLKESRINRSVKRIIKIKQKYEISDKTPIEKINIEEINQQIEEIRQMCEI